MPTTGEEAVNKGIHRIVTAAAIAVLALATTPALPADLPPCPAGTDQWIEYRLFFGRSKGGEEVVTDEAWRAFLAEEITPRFPDGLSVLDAAGQWRDASDTIVRERSKLVLILAEPGAPGLQLTEEIAQAYRHAFDQESVLRVVTTACVSF